MGKSFKWSFIAKRIVPVASAILTNQRQNRRPGQSLVLDALVGRKGVLKDNQALGVLIGAGIEVGQGLYNRPGFRATLNSAMDKAVGGDGEDYSYPARVEGHATWIAAQLRACGVYPNRIAVDGVPGSGKTTLARVLAKRLNMRWTSLDHMNVDVPLDLTEERMVYEHHRLLRTQDVNGFDAIVYIDEPVETSKEKVLKRRRGGYLLEIMDYDRLKRVGKKAFSTAAGESFRVPKSDLRVKLRPHEGFCIKDNVARELRRKGVSIDGLSQEQLLFLATERQARRGFLAYVDASTVGREMLMSACSAITYLAKHR